MSRTIPNDFSVEIEGKEYFPICLLEFYDGVSTYRYTTLDVPVTISGVGTYNSRGFSFENVKYSLGNVVDSATVIIDNVDQVMTSIFVEGVIQGNDAKLSVAVLDEGGVVISVVDIFNGQADSWELNEESVRLVVSTDFAQWSRKTVSFHSSSCRWKEFKGTECQYSGAETWCDRSYSRCGSLLNTDNFGGFRWLPDFENREIFWGPAVEKTVTVL